MKNRLRNALPLLVALLAAAAFGHAVDRLRSQPRNFPEQDIAVILPRFAQVLMTGGDRYLAANLAVVRVLLNPTAQDTHEHYAGQARVQVDASWLNPRHEDNYYLAAGYLSWSGYVSEAEQILERAANARPFDMLPPFFLAFDYYHFDRMPAQGARWMYEAGRRADSEQNRAAMSHIAARWAERGQNPEEALRVVEMMQQQTRSQALRNYLEQRVARLRQLIALQASAREYLKRYGVPPARLDQLVQSGILHEIPVDPTGLGYVLDESGIPQLAPPAHGVPPRVATHRQ